MNATANDNSATETVTREGAMLVYRNIKDRDSVRFGLKHFGRVCRGQHAAIEKGKRIVLWGVDRNTYNGIRPYRLEFKVGDRAVYDSFNLTYTGVIVAIGEKTVTIESYPGTCNARKHRLSLYEFNWRNNDYNAAEIARRNSEWRD